MEVIAHLRNSFRRSSSAPSLATATVTPITTDSNNNMRNHNTMTKHKTRHSCGICGKHLVKIGRWKNYFTLPCRCRHMFCKQCITGRLACRQKVLHSPSFDVMWTFPCPGNKECKQQLTVDWSRGSSYSKNLVAHDGGDDSRESDEFDQDDLPDDLLGNPGVDLDKNLGEIMEVSEVDNGSVREYG